MADAIKKGVDAAKDKVSGQSINLINCNRYIALQKWHQELVMKLIKLQRRIPIDHLVIVSAVVSFGIIIHEEKKVFCDRCRCCQRQN